MSSIHNTRYGTLEVRWRENGRPKSKTCKTPEEADALKRKVDRKLDEGKPVMRAKDVPTLEEFGVERLAAMTHLEEQTLTDYCQVAERHLFPYLGHLPVVLIRPSVLADWQKERLAEGAGPSSIGRAQVVLSLILKQAVLPYEYLEYDPTASLPRPGYKKKPHRWLTAEEVEAIRGWYLERDDVGSAALVSVQAYVGIRPEDTLARIWPDFARHDNGHFELTVTTKNVDGEIVPGSKTGDDHKRRVYVPQLVASDLEEWRREGQPTIYLFGRAKDGQPWTKSDYDNWRCRGKKKRADGTLWRPSCFRAAGEALGLGDALKPYDLRHTFATLAANAGWTSDEIAHQLGNSTEVVERVYRHMLDAAPRPNRRRRSIDDYLREARGLAPVPVPAAEEVELVR